MIPFRLHILIVDDDEVTCYLLGRMLRAAGFAVSEAGSAAACRALLTRGLPDLLLLDVNLPDIDGRELVRQLRSEPATEVLPIVQVSAARVEGHEIGAALDFGADAYLTLPVDAVELVATVRAVLRARRAEEAAHQFARQWQKTFDALSDGVCVVGRDGAVQRCNRAFCEVIGRGFADVIGAPFAAVIGPALGDDALPVRELSQLRAGVVVQAQAHDRWLRVAADPVLDDAHQLTGAVLTITDITGQKRVEEAMRRSNAELLQANRIKDEFLATLSHELRTPLNAIVGWARLMRSGQLDPRSAERALETIDRNATLQAKLVEDLLDVSRIITGKLRLHLGQVDPVSVIEASIHAVRPAADAKGIRIETRLEDSNGTITADGDRLQQVLWNLLSNAIKFTPRGGTVRVGLRGAPEGLLLEVCDDGCGIEPAFLPFVFDRFRQADASITRSHGGLGLGLAIVRHLVELHGGTVVADSGGVGHGARFTVTLPWQTRARLRRPSSPSLPAVTVVPASAAPPLLAGVRVLIVDDEEDARELLAAAFALMGAEVSMAGGAAEARTVLAKARPQVLISDIGMPGEDGYSLIRRLRAGEAAGVRLPAVALTAYATQADVKRALAAGYDVHVSKPVDAPRLARIVADLLEPAAEPTLEDTQPLVLLETKAER